MQVMRWWSLVAAWMTLAATWWVGIPPILHRVDGMEWRVLGICTWCLCEFRNSLFAGGFVQSFCFGAALTWNNSKHLCMKSLNVLFSWKLEAVSVCCTWVWTTVYLFWAQKLIWETAGRKVDVGLDPFDSAPSLEFVIEWFSRRYSHLLGAFCKLENIVSVYFTQMYSIGIFACRSSVISWFLMGTRVHRHFSLFILICAPGTFQIIGYVERYPMNSVDCWICLSCKIRNLESAASNLKL